MLNAFVRTGFLLALRELLMVRPGGLMFAGLPCSAHIWLASGSSKKNRINPRGKTSLKFVRMGNMQASRFSLMVLVAKVRRVWWGCEQPNGSVAPYLHYMQLALYTCLYLLGFASSIFQRMQLGSNPYCYTQMCKIKNYFISIITKTMCQCKPRSIFQLRWMGLFGHRSLKRTHLFGDAFLVGTKVFPTSFPR